MYNWWFLLWVHSFGQQGRIKKQEDDGRFFYTGYNPSSWVQLVPGGLLMWAEQKRTQANPCCLGKAAAADINQHSQIHHSIRGRWGMQGADSDMPPLLSCALTMLEQPKGCSVSHIGWKLPRLSNRQLIFWGSLPTLWRAQTWEKAGQHLSILSKILSLILLWQTAIEKFSVASLEENQVLTAAVLCREDHSDWRRVKSVSDKCNHCHPVVPRATAYVWKNPPCTISQKTHLTLVQDFHRNISFISRV